MWLQLSFQLCFWSFRGNIWLFQLQNAPLCSPASRLERLPAWKEPLWERWERTSPVCYNELKLTWKQSGAEDSRGQSSVSSSRHTTTFTLSFDTFIFTCLLYVFYYVCQLRFKKETSIIAPLSKHLDTSFTADTDMILGSRLFFSVMETIQLNNFI